MFFTLLEISSDDLVTFLLCVDFYLFYTFIK